MHREYRDTRLFRRVLQSIWHQVNNGLEVFVVGRILDDDPPLPAGTADGVRPRKVPLLVPSFDEALFPRELDSNPVEDHGSRSTPRVRPWSPGVPTHRRGADRQPLGCTPNEIADLDG